MLEAPPSLHGSRLVRGLLWIVGVTSLALGVIGIVLPGLPTTPFVLIAGACFVRASPRAHAWLLRNRLFGRMVRDWEQHHSIPMRVKAFALSAMLLTAAFSLAVFDGRAWLQVAVLVGVGMGTLVVLAIPTRR